MQTYLDVSLIIAIVIAVVLLFMIIISFVMLNARVKKLTIENTSLKETLLKEVTALKTAHENYEKNMESLERKIKASDMSLQYLTNTQQDLVDKQKVINSSFDNLSVKVEQQKKEIEDKTVENQPIILAKRLLAEGLSLDEVVKKTNLPQYEVEMLAKVHRLTEKLEKNELPKSNAPTLTIDNENTRVTQEPPKEATVAPIEPQAKPPVKTTPSKTPHVANLKAREAYGIGAKTGLRRPR